MTICDINNLLKKSLKDGFVCTIVSTLFIFSILISTKFSLILGVGIIIFFISGCATITVLLRHKDFVSFNLLKFKLYFGYGENHDNLSSECNACGITKCPRHLKNPSEDNWKYVAIDEELDKSVEKFYDIILNNFVVSWFSEFSNDEQFLYLLRLTLREATNRLVIKIKEINTPVLITNKLLPCFLSHYELIKKMLDDGVPMDKLPATFLSNRYPIHPAVHNRQTEINYLRGIVKFLIPRLFKNDNFESKIFFSLIRETLTCWVFVPLLDVISDPNLINLLIVLATNPKSPNDKDLKFKEHKRVMLLENFVNKISIKCIENAGGGDKIEENIDLMADQKILYNFMQFMKKEGAVDILRFYLDVDNLNKELLDPKATTDPTKLSSLQTQSETLFEAYKKLIKHEKDKSEIKTLSEAHEDVKNSLQTRWKRAFYKTRGYFELLYGSRDLTNESEEKANEGNLGPVSRFSSKIKGAIRGAVDGAPIEALEVPTVWDGLSEPQLPGNSTIYNSVTQKLRKERGQNLDSFMTTLMLSIEQNTDIGEDVTEIQNEEIKRPEPPIKNLVFGDLFELKSINKLTSLSVRSLPYPVVGPSKCLIYILVRILRAPTLIVRFVLALISVSEKCVNSIICLVISKLIRLGLYEPRLAHLIDLLREILFINKLPEPTAQELLDRQKLARQRLEKRREGLGKVSDTLQSPPLNKHLIYCLVDLILVNMFPELETTQR